MAIPSEIDTSGDFLEVRDVIVRQAYVRSELDLDDFEVSEGRTYLSEDEREEYEEEIANLDEAAAAITAYANLDATLIADDHFEEWAQEYAGHLHGDTIVDAEWPFGCIDWSEAAEQLQSEFTSIEAFGETWWVR